MTPCIVPGDGPAEYEWAYLDDDMNPPGGPITWIPLCEDCCMYWRREATKVYRVRTLLSGVRSQRSHS